MNIKLVEPKHPALHSVTNINPFDDKDVNWEERGQQVRT